MFVAQFLASLVATSYDLRLPFSNSRRAAEFIRHSAYADAVLVGDPDSSTSPVGAWLRREMYYPQAGRAGTFAIWDTARSCSTLPYCLSDEELMTRARAALGPGRDLGLLVLDRPLRVGVPVATFTGSLVWGSEDYYLYVLRRAGEDQAGTGERR